MDGPIDEESRRSANLARRLAAGDVAANPVQYRVAEPVGFEARNVEPQLGRIAPQVLVLEGRLTVKEQVVSLSEAPLRGARLGRAGGREGVRVDLGQREVPEAEPNAPIELPLDELDSTRRLSRVRALVIAVLQDHPRANGPADAVDSLFERFEAH